MKTEGTTQEAEVRIPLVQAPPYPEQDDLSAEEKTELKEKIKKQLQEQNAVLVAHYYTDGDLQDLAEETGGCVADSLEMARFGAEQEASTLVVAGVRFMGETSKILNIEKRVLMPDLAATCSLDEGCPIDQFRAYCDQYPDHTVLCMPTPAQRLKLVRTGL